MYQRDLVSIVIVTWNSSDTLVQCLQSIERQTYESVEVIIVDNGSLDPSVAIATQLLPNAKVLPQGRNLGFCLAQNIGIASSKGEYIMPLNPDVSMQPGFLANLVRSLQPNPDIGMATGKLLLSGDSGRSMIDSTGMFVDKSRRQYLRGHGKEDLGQYDRPGYVFGSCGAAPLYRRSMLEDIQVEGDYFDTDFFAHKEDFDLAWRAQLLGWKAWYEPNAVAYHDRTFRPGSHNRKAIASSVRGNAVRNRYFVIIKNEIGINLLRDVIRVVFYDVLIMAYVLAFERSSIPAIGQAVRGLPRMLSKRRSIMRRRRVTAKYMRYAMESTT